MQNEKNNADVTNEALDDDECNDGEEKAEITLMRYFFSKKF